MTRKQAWLTLAAVIVVAIVIGLVASPTEEAAPVAAPSSPTPTPGPSRNDGRCFDGSIPAIAIVETIRAGVPVPDSLRPRETFGVPAVETKGAWLYDPDLGWLMEWSLYFTALTDRNVAKQATAYGVYTPDCIPILISIE